MKNKISRFYWLRICCFLLLGIGIGHAETKTKLQNTEIQQTSGQATSVMPAGQPVNGITRGVASRGVTSCASRIQQLTDFVSGNAAVGAYAFVPSNQPDQHLLSLSMEAVQPSQQYSYSSLTFAPNQANGCGAVYDAVVWWPNSCAEVAKEQFKDAKIQGVLKKNIQVAPLEASGKVFLMPTKDGCISIKKEIVSR